MESIFAKMSTNRICTREGCGNPIITAYRVAGLPEEYCSRACLEEVLNAKLQPAKPKKQAGPTKQEDAVKDIAKEFGDANLVRHICDRPGCGKPVTLLWKGRDGEYCSNNCLKLSERKEGVNKVTEATAAVEATESPVTAGKTKTTKTAKTKKKVAPAAKKKVAAKAKTKKAAAAAATSNGDLRETINNRRVIKLTKKASDMRADTRRQDIYEMIKSGMTVRELQEKAVKHFDSKTWMNRAVAILRVCEEKGLVTVSSGE